MKKLLIIIDMQNDFVTGSLGTPEAQAIVPNIKAKIDKYKEKGWDVVFTQDTHFAEDYINTLEGKKLPIPHCIYCTEGWKVIPELEKVDYEHFVKTTFGLEDWPTLLDSCGYEEIELVGVCTDICVVSNALALRMFYPNTPIIVDASCCAGVTLEKHKAALEVMKSCQIDVIGE